ncbi:tetratricopeptide repeat protein [Cellulophaga lytica]|uniref:Tetratricopeptide TPR_1 repeat-containing protein n=1 Tax=Cellulophaga lytica (strain ATCC 23178 / DSM 7489 / JCM 8516 / NBRC 14961 / NCIMB 1423 / VKM B-1433 / Cy l20) TaxID=867900 RepID=F0RBG8_CELLC|nr:tetratricopeptide repeat protein [Cellulophaga lytica]ADY29590.1 Tetratricopeptide TPR_1 repeat-containing protein [Cellulophaga lytica DSM 7489]WQG76239.1 tetratricopeptide repeat protein [Cellulophaga lytica]
MRIFILILACCFAQLSVGQNSFLAKQYYDDGDFDKAVVFYERLVKENPRRSDYQTFLISCYQQLERYSDAEKQIKKNLDSPNPIPVYYIDLGHNYTLQGNNEEAKKYYDLAYSKVEENPRNGYGLAYKFQNYSLLEYAAKTYNKAMELNPALDFNFQLARIYGEQGNVEKMFTSLLNIVAKDPNRMSSVIRNLDDFITTDSDNRNNTILKKLILKNAQRSPDIIWNEMLSWLFIQQKQFYSAFSQEKAIYKRSQDNSLRRLQTLANICVDENEKETAQEIYNYIVVNSPRVDNVKLYAELQRIALDLDLSNNKNTDATQKAFAVLLETYGYKPHSIMLQLRYANFLAFKKDETEEATFVLKKTLELQLNRYEEAKIKMALADILVYNKRFNEALIYYTQIQKNLKNDVLAQNARFKVAKASFYKGDFDWALAQLKVLRSSTSQLIANDAMQLSLLISDNSLQDSTQTALKKYATADLLAYQNKTTEAIAALDDILENHKGEKIEDEALLKQAELLIKQQEYEKAELNYLKIIEFYKSGILADDAHYALGELYRTILYKPEEAKYHYEKIIYGYQDSYFFPLARKEFRKLRGDAIN